MSANERPEAAITAWAHVLDGNEEPLTIDRWKGVFQEHREFFLAYQLRGEEKAALRWRYVKRKYNPKTDKDYPGEEWKKLPEDQQELLTTRPLADNDIETLLNTSRTQERATRLSSAC